MRDYTYTELGTTTDRKWADEGRIMSIPEFEDINVNIS